jgi:DNA polymerase-4
MIAKIGSDLNKPRGLVWVPEGSEEAFLRPLPVSRLPGVGKVTDRRLQDLGLRLVGDVQRLGEPEAVRLLGRAGGELFQAAFGRVRRPVVPDTPAKSVGNEVTFDRDTTDRTQLLGVLSALCEKVARRLRADGRAGRTVTLKFRYTGFETHTAARTLGSHTADDRVLHEIAAILFDTHVDPVRPIRLLGVTVSGLGEEAQQLDLLESTADSEQERRLAQALDFVRERHGAGAIRRASSRPGRTRSWG